MTSTSNINVNSTTAVSNPLKSSGIQQMPADGLLGFLTALFQNQNAQPAQNLQNMPGESGALSALTAKVSALLRQDGGTDDAKALTALHNLLAKLPQESADQLRAAIQSLGIQLPEAAATGTTATLTSDLSASLASALQAAQEPKTPTAKDADNIAALLNEIDTGGENNLSDDILAKLQAAYDSALAADKNAKDIRTDLLAVLQDPAADLGGASVEEYLAAFGRQLALNDTTQIATALDTETSVLQPVFSNLPAQITPRATPELKAPKAPLPAQDADTGNLVSDDPYLPASDEEARSILEKLPRPMARNMPEITLPAAAANAPAPTPTPAKSSALNSNGLGGLVSASSLGAALGQNGGFDQGGFGNQNGSTPNGLPHSLNAEGLAINNSSAAPANFINYMHAARQGQSPTTQMVGLQISRNASAKIDTFTMQLDPVDLGQLEVRMKFEKDGRISARLIAEKPETLAMLQRDAMHLERILQQTGLEIDENALTFDLRQQHHDHLHEGDQRRADHDDAGRNGHAARNDNAISAEIAVETAGYISARGVNIMV